jgi:hypothetical protein
LYKILEIKKKRVYSPLIKKLTFKRKEEYTHVSKGKSRTCPL